MTQLGLTATMGDSLLTGHALQVQCDPASIELGVSCGMSDMCGESPCLCGQPDAWGDCACNGTQTTTPALMVSSSNNAAAWPVCVDGSWQLVSLLPGEADVTVTAQLKHYDDATQTLHVSAAAPSLCVVLGVVVVVAVIAGIAALARKRGKTADKISSPSGGEE